MEFCPKCGTWIRLGAISCPRCGYAVLYEDKNKILVFMERLLVSERSEEKRRALRDRVPAEVIDVSGDVVGYVAGEYAYAIEPLGTVISGGRFLTVSLYGQHELEEGRELELCEAEVLVGYDLQLELIRRIRSGELNDLERRAVSCVFGKLTQHEIKRVRLERNSIFRV